MHPLLKTTRRTPAQPHGVRPKDATYDFEKGIWCGANGPICNDSSYIAVSKKCDIETGEDQKGQ